MIKKDKIQLRHKAIKSLINSYEIGDQNMLTEMLNSEYKITANQSIISRDLRQLGIIKRKFKDKMVYELPKINIQKEILRLSVSDITHNESLIVIKTTPGVADFVGDFIDLQDDLEIIGTISGENTVFVAPKSIKKINAIYKKLCTVLYFNK